MMRKLVIAFAAALILAAGLTFTASARGGGGGGHVAVDMVVVDTVVVEWDTVDLAACMADLVGVWDAAALVVWAVLVMPLSPVPAASDALRAVGPSGFRGNRFAFNNRSGFRNRFFRNRFAFRRHRFFRNRFAFGFGAAFPYYDSCYASVWTPWGWRWTNVCY